MDKENHFMKDGKIVKKFNHRENPPKTLDLSKGFTKELLNISNGKKVPLSAWRIIWGLFSQLKTEQFNSNHNHKQLSLFEDELLSDHGQFATVKLKNTDINPNRRKQEIKKGLRFLMNLPADEIEMTREDGRKVTVWTRPIMGASTEERGYTELVLSAYWVKNILDITSGYDSVLYKTLIQIKSSNTIDFLLWLIQLSEDENGITLKFLNKRFNCKYGTCKNFCLMFLSPIKKELDSKSMVSFNYSYDESKSKISIVRYNNKAIDLIALEAPEKRLINGKYYTNQYKKKHDLSKRHYESILGYLSSNDYKTQQLFLDGYKAFKKECREKKTAITEIKGESFVEMFQEKIKECYLKTTEGKRFPNNYPKI